jgi:hypothetical protein
MSTIFINKNFETARNCQLFFNKFLKISSKYQIFSLQNFESASNYRLLPIQILKPLAAINCFLTKKFSAHKKSLKNLQKKHKNSHRLIFSKPKQTLHPVERIFEPIPH